MSEPELTRINPRMTLEHEIRQAIAELDLISHVNSVSLDTSDRDTSDSIGGKRPPGGDQEHPKTAEERSDYRTSYQLKSASDFRHRLKTAHSEHAKQAILNEARETLAAWKRAPLPTGQDPQFGSPQWKRWVASSDLSAATIAHRFNVSRQYVHRIRRQYREAA